jgi:hypothetical protein
MNEKELEDFRSELKELCGKYGITDIVFGGSFGNSFIGFFGVEAKSMNDLVNIVCNASRLYQAGREKVLKTFDNMAKIGK